MNIAEILLRIRGEDDGGERMLDRIERKLTEFDRRNAQARADVDTKAARAALMKLDAELKRLDGKQVDINVNVKRGMLDRFGTFVQKAGLSLKGILVPGLVELVGMLAPAIFSLANAAMGLGALAIAAGGAGLALGALAGGALLRFKAQADKAGTAAHALKAAAKDLGKAFQSATAGGADAVFRGLSSLFHTITPQVAGLKGAFTTLGTALGGALRNAAPQVGKLVQGFGQLVTASAPLAGPLVNSLVSIGQILINIARAAMPFLVRGAQAFSQVLAGWASQTGNISGLRAAIANMVGDLKQWWKLGVQIWRVFTGLFTALKGDGRGVVMQLTQATRAFADWLHTAEGQKKTREFFRQTFFAVKDVAKAMKEILPTAAALMQALGMGATLILHAILPVLHAFNSLPAPIRAVAGAFILIKAGIGPFVLLRPLLTGLGALFTRLIPILYSVGVAAFAAFGWWLIIPLAIAAIVLILAKLGLLDNVLRAIGSIATAIFNAIKFAIMNGLLFPLLGPLALIPVIIAHFGALKGALIAVWNAIKTATLAVWNALKAAASAVFNAIKTVITTIVRTIANVVKAVFNGMKAAVMAVWNALKAAASAVFNAIKSVIGSAARGAAAVAKAAFNALKSAAVAAFHAVLSAAKSIFNAVKAAISTAIHAALAVVKGIAGAFFDAGKAIIEAMINGIKSMAGAAVDAVKGVIHGAMSLLPGSEPKDKTSPLAGLDKRGEAIIRNIVAGIDRAGSRLPDALAMNVGALAPELATAGAALAAPAPVAGGDQHFNIYGVPGTGEPDPEVIMARLAMKQRLSGGNG